MKKPEGHSTVCVHGGERSRKPAGAVATPIFQTATYSFSSSAEVRAYQEGSAPDLFEYGRYGSPSERALEGKLAEICGAEDALVTSSGMAAVCDTLLAVLGRGKHLVLSSECYRRTRLFAEQHLSRFGVRVTYAGPDADSMVRAITRRTRAVFVELPTNPHLYVPDLPRIAAAARKHGALTIVDPTVAGPYNIDAFAQGADLVTLSLTKYLAGHNDVIAGAVLGARRQLEAVRDFHGTAGTLLAPATAYLVQRGIKTLALRVPHQNESAERVAAFLESHAAVRQVYYPGLPSHRDHAIAKRLMSGFGCVVSFRLRSDLAGTERFLDRLRLFKIAPSFGGVDSLAEGVATMSFWNYTRAERRRLDIPDDLVRLSIGIEDAGDLIADLHQALAAEGRRGDER
jgi:cystathionine gamma-synthase